MFEIALYGGAFNPPHAGHAQVMIEASRQARRVLVVPSFRHPDGKQMVDYDVRLNWLESIVETVQSLCCAELRASRVEQVVARGVEGAIYSYTLLGKLSTGVIEYLKGLGVEQVIVGGLALDLSLIHI